MGKKIIIVQKRIPNDFPPKGKRKEDGGCCVYVLFFMFLIFLVIPFLLNIFGLLD